LAAFGKIDASTAICSADRSSITMRGRDFVNEVVGCMSLSAFIYFHLTGNEATPQQSRMLDALIIAISEHGLAPTAIAARMTYSSGPEALQGAVAAGILGAGSVVLGSAAEAAVMMKEGIALANAGMTVAEAAEVIARSGMADNKRLPGFGHPLHKPDDPRSVRLLDLSDTLGVSGPHVAFLRHLCVAVDTVNGRHLPLNIQGPIAAIGLDMGFPAFLTRAIPILARTIGVLGHIAEEAQNPIGFHLAQVCNDAVEYCGPDGERRKILNYE
jgi:citrate synthase